MTPPTSTLDSARALHELTKPGIVFYVVLTVAAAFWVASARAVEGVLLAQTLAAVWIATAGSLALNQYVERRLDGLMKRTRTRPLPSGKLEPRTALVFSILLLVIGTAWLWFSAGPVPALLTAAAGVAYNGIYTPLKTRSYAATLVGAVPGAVPALIGWSAATGSLPAGAWILFTMAFLWQLPHVMGLAWLLREDYERAGIILAPPAGSDGRPLAMQSAVYSGLLILVSLGPTLIGLTGQVYLIGAVVAGALLFGTSIRSLQGMDRAGARRMFFGSLAYQPLILLLLVIDTVPG